MSLSNAPDGYPQKNVEGLDLWYPIGGDGKPTGKARPMFEGQTFEDMDEVRLYQANVAKQPKNPVGVFIDGTGMFSPSELSDDDLAYIKGEVLEYRQATKINNRDLFRDMIKAPHQEIARLIQRADLKNPGGNKWYTNVAATVAAERRRLQNYYSPIGEQGKVRTDQFGNRLLPKGETDRA